jgi:hypothetical protein
LSNKIEGLERFLIEKLGVPFDTFAKLHSPRQLNEEGLRLFKESGASNYLDSNKEKLLSLLSEISPKSALDVESSAIRVCLDASKEDDYIPIKNFLYNNPVFANENIFIGTIAFVMGIQLRNIYLSLHPELEP